MRASSAGATSIARSSIHCASAPSTGRRTHAPAQRARWSDRDPRASLRPRADGRGALDTRRRAARRAAARSAPGRRARPGGRLRRVSSGRAGGDHTPALRRGRGTRRHGAPRRAGALAVRCRPEAHRRTARRAAAVARPRRGLRPDERALLRRVRASRRELRAAARRLSREGGAPFFAFESHFADILARGGFDLVAGNPPWVRGERVPAQVRETLATRYATWRPAHGPGFAHLPDLAVAFVERALELAAPGGAVALLVPAKLASSGYAEPLRRRLATSTRLERVAPVAQGSAFGGEAAIYPMALVAARLEPTGRERVATAHGPDGRPRARLPAELARALDPHIERLCRRSDYRGGPAWQLFRIALADAPCRVIWPDLARRLAAVVPDVGVVPLNTVYGIATRAVDDAYALAALFNSRWLTALARLSADPARGGFRRFNAGVVRALPLPPANPTQWRALVDQGRANVSDDDAIADMYELEAADRRALDASAADPL